jgi:hypothetical protein
MIKAPIPNLIWKKSGIFGGYDLFSGNSGTERNKMVVVELDLMLWLPRNWDVS